MEAFDKERFTISGKIVNKKEKEFLALNNCRWCARCKKAKDVEEFWPTQYGCKDCTKKLKLEWASLNPDYYADYRSVNKNRQAIAHADWFARNKEKKNQQNRDWYYANKDKTRERNKRNREVYKKDPQYKLRKALRQRIYSCLLGMKSKKTMELIGCDMAALKIHLESLFQEGMTWENYGNPNGDHSDGWHVDHIKPCASFDLQDLNQQKECFHYTNLQPLWGRDNIAKGSKLNPRKLST